MKVLYIGAGTDITPLQTLTFIKHFIFIDGQPFSEFGIQQCGIICKSDEYGEYDGFSRPRF